MDSICRERMLALENEAITALAKALGLAELPEFAELPKEHLPAIIANAVTALGFDIGDIVVELLRLGAIKAAEMLAEKLVQRGKPGTQKICDYTAWDAVKRFLRGEWLRTPPEKRIEIVGTNRRLPTTDSFRRYAKLKPGMRFSEALRAGVTGRDLKEWARMGDIELGEAR